MYCIYVANFSVGSFQVHHWSTTPSPLLGQVALSEEKPKSFAEMCGPNLSAETLALPGTGTGPAEPEMGPEKKSPTMEGESPENMNPAILRMVMDMGHNKEEAMKIYRDQYAVAHVGLPKGEPRPKSSEITTKLYEEDGDRPVAKIASHSVEEAELSVKEEQVEEAGVEVEIEDRK